MEPRGRPKPKDQEEPGAGDPGFLQESGGCRPLEAVAFCQVVSRPMLTGCLENISQWMVAPITVPSEFTTFQSLPSGQSQSLSPAEILAFRQLLSDSGSNQPWVPEAQHQGPGPGRFFSPSLGVFHVAGPCLCNPFLISLFGVQVVATQGSGIAAFWRGH